MVLLISIVIGIVFQFTGNHQKTTHEYLMAEKSSSMFPVIMSISVSLASGIAMVGLPADAYRYGSQYAMIGFSIGIGMLISTYIFLPVYFQCNVTSIYELVPYFIVTRMHEIPGLIGLTFVGVFSGSLSSISSALNSLSTVTVIDFLTPLCPFDLSDSKLVVIAKGLSSSQHNVEISNSSSVDKHGTHVLH
ncbi:unnamed protein product [Larinioides sclopetarius]|uniref:Sodium-coupled monocarboxylate transporter 1 n=1 Tax=Larinioides sclopetarius TaxID=280406 RepID=A0AAV2BHP0_9ARAC